MPENDSSVRVEVTFDNPVVFAGESLEAVVSFRNTTGTSRRFSKGHRSQEIDTGSQSATGSDQDGRPGRKFSVQMVNPLRGIYSGAEGNGDISSTGALKRSQTVKLARNQSQGLLMGYIQIQGYFVIDETIVNPEAFSSVKTQAFVMGFGHGHDDSSRQRGIPGLSGLSGLSGLAGLGGLLDKFPQNGSEQTQSTPALNEQQALPIFSTPQTLLFVDLKLLPGQTKSFSYKIELPRTLPPSCRGKSIRIHYNLIVGTQKLDSRGVPVPKIFHIPFRVFPYIDGDGTQSIHSLDHPIVQRTDEATTRELEDSKSTNLDSPGIVGNNNSEDGPKQFGNYVNMLLSRRRSSLGSIDEPQGLQPLSRLSSLNQGLSSKSNIEFFVRYQQAAAGRPLKSNFDIDRGGYRIASLSISKPVYRIGEDVVLVLDFSKAAIKCFHVTASLETVETIDEEFSMSTEIPTRTYAQVHGFTYSSRKSTFELAIPVTATPQFSTSLINLAWSLKLDFITNSYDSVEQRRDSQTGDISYNEFPHQLLDAHTMYSASILRPVSHDDRGELFIAKNKLSCHAFSCRIPLQVLPTNKDIGALLGHSTYGSKSWTV